MAKRLEGKQAVVTGGATGLGFAMAQLFLSEGADVVIAGDIEEQLVHAQSRLAKEYPQNKVVQVLCDVTEEQQVENLFADLGDVDIAIANAGSGMPGAILQLDKPTWRYVLDLNVIGTALTIKHAGLNMRGHKKGGSIVTLSSIAATRPSRYMSPYSTSKAAVETLTKCAAVELGEMAVRVNCIAPGLILTEVTKAHLPESYHAGCISESQLKRCGLPEEVARTALYLCSEDAEFVTGQVLAVDGGLNIHAHDYTEMVAALFGEEYLSLAKPL